LTPAAIPPPEVQGKPERGQKDRSIPSLDGLRAISIALVILSHAPGTRGFPFAAPGALFDHGILGVQIFFVISGFLITTLLFDEQAKTGGVSLRLFYMRRTLRIFPPFYAFLGVMAALVIAGQIRLPWTEFAFAALYAMNYRQAGLWMLGHIWSLSVEEQFYLVWPSTLKWIGRQRALMAAAVVALGSPLVCLAWYLKSPDSAGMVSHSFPLIADAIAAGCVLAGVLPWLRSRPELLRLFGSRWGDLVWPVTFALDLARPHPRIHMAFTETGLNVAICYALIRYTQFPALPVSRLLNLPAMKFVGKLSYSLYLWQQPFMDRFGTSVLQTFPLNVGCSFGSALASWYLIESPMQDLRRKFRPRPLASAAAAR
jgi:peptidoglycan/LPS O-acetylase OafA/YrhL